MTSNPTTLKDRFKLEKLLPLSTRKWYEIMIDFLLHLGLTYFADILCTKKELTQV
jgi:hypothetical protein